MQEWLHLLSSDRLVIAHRGDRAHAPENTLAAFERAARAGVDAIELDVHLTADGHVVVCHDATVDRTTEARGPIASMQLAAVKELDAGARWTPHADPELANRPSRSGPTPFAGTGIRIPTLDEVLESFPGMPFIVEAKSGAVGVPLVEVIRRHNARARVMVGSYHIEALQPARAAGFATTAAQRELVGLIPAATLGFRARAPNASALAIPPTHHGIPVPVRGYVRAVTLPVLVWTVNNAAAARRYWDAGVRGIISDDPAAMLAAR